MDTRLPKNWQEATISDVCYPVSNTFDFKQYKKFIFINTGDIEEGGFLHRNYFQDNHLPGQAKKSINKLDILYSEIRPKNKHFAFIDFDADEYVVSTKLMVIRNRNNILPEFLYLLLTNNMTIDNFQAIAESRSGTFPQLTFDAIANYAVNLPSLYDQKKILIFLNAVINKIEINNKIAKTLEEMAQALFKEWFVHFRFPGYEKAEFVDNELGTIPKGWKLSRFEEYARLEYGKALQEEKRIPGNVLVYGSSGQVGTHTEKLCEGPGIVVGRKGNVGSVFWINEDFYPIDTTFYLSTKNSLYYIYFILKNMKFHTGDSAVPGLNRDSVHSQEIVIPDEMIIGQFNLIIKPIFEKLNKLQGENQKLAVLRNLLLPKLMRGEIRV